MSTAVRTMAVDEFLALPEDGVERWLIDGELRENELRQRSDNHLAVTTKLAALLREWAESESSPRGVVATSGHGVRCMSQSGMIFLVDVAYISPTADAQYDSRQNLIQGAATLVVDVLSLDDQYGKIGERVKAMLKSGIKHVWVVDPELEYVVIHQPGKLVRDPEGILTAKPELPGLAIPLATVFE